MKKRIISIATVLCLILVCLVSYGITASAKSQTWQGGRHDITLGTHSNTAFVTAQVSQTTRVEMWDKNWKSVWSGDFNGTKTFSCGSNVYYFTIYLDSNKFGTLTW